jgi:5-methylcytosine-specific restriction endonuclease McrA
LLKRLTDAVTGKAPITAKRSTQWAKVRAAYLRAYPRCAACDRSELVEVHHIVPFHIAPELELQQSNLIALCENKKNGINCHLYLGHLGNYKSYNTTVRLDAEATLNKFKNRPL